MKIRQQNENIRITIGTGVVVGLVSLVVVDAAVIGGRVVMGAAVVYGSSGGQFHVSGGVVEGVSNAISSTAATKPTAIKRASNTS